MKILDPGSQPALRSILSLGAITTLILLLAGSVAAEPVLYLVTVNTRAVNGTSGFLDFQFNPGTSASQVATAQISSFNGDGGSLIFNSNSPQLTGDVSG